MMAVALALSGLAASPARSQPLVDPHDALLLEARSPAALRSIQIAHAKKVQKTAPAEAAAALMYAGRSSERAGLPDSAALLYRQAAALAGTNVESLALTDLLLRTATGRGLIEAYQVVASMLARTPPDAYDYADVQLRSMWLQHLAAHRDSAAAALKRAGAHPLPGIWRLRAARVLLEDAGDPAGAGAMLVPLETSARGQDAEIHALLVAAAMRFGRSEAEIAEVVEALIRARDLREDLLLTSLGAQRVMFAASDGFLLSGVVRPAANPGAPVAVVLSRGDTLAHYDSLLVHLGTVGFTSILVEPRGHGLSVGPPCAQPFRWEGRENELEERLARDAGDAVRALTAFAEVDTQRRIVVGTGFTAGAALRAAEHDDRFEAVVLASAEPARVDRGILLGRVAKIRRPMFLQTAPEDLVDLYYYTDALYQAGDRRASRVSSGVASGRFAEQFRRDPASGARLRRWFAERAPAAKR
jgi:hypothetical protein